MGGHKRSPGGMRGQPVFRLFFRNFFLALQEAGKVAPHGHVAVQGAVKVPEAAQKGIADGPVANAAYGLEAFPYCIRPHLVVLELFLPLVQGNVAAGDSPAQLQQGGGFDPGQPGGAQRLHGHCRDMFRVGETHDAAGVPDSRRQNEPPPDGNGRLHADKLPDDRPTERFKRKNRLHDAQAAVGRDHLSQLGVSGIRGLKGFHGLQQPEHAANGRDENVRAALVQAGDFFPGAVGGKTGRDRIPPEDETQPGGEAVPENALVQAGPRCFFRDALGVPAVEVQEIPSPVGGRQRERCLDNLFGHGRLPGVSGVASLYMETFHATIDERRHGRKARGGRKKGGLAAPDETSVLQVQGN